MNKKLIITLIIILLTLIISLTFFIVLKTNFNKNDENSIELSSTQQENHEDEKKQERLVVEMEEEKIYGYDENAMQVEESYDGFPACGFIEIEKTNLALPILSNQTVAGMEYSCCKLYSTGELNISGNTYLVGHNYDNNTLFSNNKYLEIGDKIVITGLYKNRLEYTIYNIFNTTSDDVSYLSKPIDKNDIEITIQTCNNDAEDTRLIIEAVHHKK